MYFYTDTLEPLCFKHAVARAALGHNVGAYERESASGLRSCVDCWPGFVERKRGQRRIMVREVSP